MTGEAHLRIPPPHSLRIESRPVRREAPSAERGVARRAIALRVTRDATLQGLPRQLAVSHEERRLRVVVPRTGEGVPAAETRLTVATRAELRRVVTIGAAHLPAVCGNGVTSEEVSRVKGATLTTGAAMTREAFLPCVTGGAALRRCRSLWSVPFAKGRGVRARACASHVRTGGPIRCGHREGCHGTRQGVHVTRGAARPGVTGGAGGRAPRGVRSVPRQECRAGV